MKTEMQVVHRLTVDDDFRSEFMRDPIVALANSGLVLGREAVAALVGLVSGENTPEDAEGRNCWYNVRPDKELGAALAG